MAASQQVHQIRQAFVNDGLSGLEPLKIIAHPDLCGWALQQGRLFELYDFKARALLCIPSLQAAEQEPVNPLAPIFYLNNSGAYSEFVPAFGGSLTARIVYAPKKILVSSLTVPQRQGGLAIWVKTEGQLNPDFVLALGGEKLPTSVGRNFMSAQISAAMLNVPGTYELRIETVRGGKAVMSSPFEIQIE